MNSNDSFLDIVQAYLKSGKVVLPVFNQTGIRVQQEAAKEDPDVRLIEKIICSDHALTAGLLHDIGKLLILKVIEVIRCSNTVSVLPSETFVLEVLNSLLAEQGY